eukprot:1721310-Prorocentrum_lima.AAC.1
MGLYYKTPLPGDREILQYVTNLYPGSLFNIFSVFICSHSSRNSGHIPTYIWSGAECNPHQSS